MNNKLMKTAILLTSMVLSLGLTACNDVQIFEERDKEGEQIKLKSDELALDQYYIKEGTTFVLTLPLKGSAQGSRPINSISVENKKRILYAGPNEDTLIPTHYKGELVCKAASKAGWNEVYLERFKDLGYSIGLYNGEYNAEENSLLFNLDMVKIENADAYKKLAELESLEIRVVGINHHEISVDNADLDGGVFINMEKGEKYLVSLYAGTYYHEIEIEADTQMFQSYEMYNYGSDYIKDTPNGYQCFVTPGVLKSGYYAIDDKGLFRYVNYAKGDGNLYNTDYNIEYYTNDLDRLANFSQQYSFTVDTRTKNLTVEALYNQRSVMDEEDIEGYIFAPDGTEYYMNTDPKKNRIWTDFSQTMPGKWTVNVVPVELEIEEFNVIDNTPAQEFTQEVYNFDIRSEKENIQFKIPFEDIANQQELDKIEISASMITPSGETYIFEKKEEEVWTGEDQNKKKNFYLVYSMAYAPVGKYTITVNHYPEKTTVSEPEVLSEYDNVTDTIVVDG